MSDRHGLALEHRVVLHDAGIEIPSGSHVHHRNGDKLDNRLENLAVLSAREHSLLHIRERGGWVRNQFGIHRLRELGGFDEPPCSDPRPDPRTHPEYWAE